MKHILLIITVLLLLLTNITIIASAQNTPSVVKKSIYSIVAIDIDDSQGKTVSRGMGFFVSQNQVVTHLSNLKDFTPLPEGVKVYIKLVGRRTRYLVDGISIPNKTNNLVLLDVSIPGAKPLPISNNTKHTGIVYSVNNSSKLMLVKGTVKGNSKDGKYIRVSNEISRKNIGGPLLNSKGEVIGISILLSELNSKFIYDDGKISISFENGGSIVSLNSTKVGGITITESKIKIGDSAFAISSNVLKNLLEKPNSVLVNSPRLKNNTDQRKSDSNRIEKTFDVNAGGTLTIDTEIGNIDVQSAAHDIAKVIMIKEAKNRSDVSQKALDDFKVTFDKKGSDLTIKGEFEHRRNYWRKQLNNLKIRFHVTVPRQYDVDLNTPTGDLSITGVTGKVQAESSAGDVTVKNVVGTVNMQTAAGDLRLDKVKGPITGRTSAGNINLAHCQGKVEVKTSAGNIHAVTSLQPQYEWNLQSSAGNIVLVLPSNLAAEIDAQTSAGNISTDFLVQGTEIRKERIRGIIKEGGKLLKLRTYAGNIRLKSRYGIVR